MREIVLDTETTGLDPKSGHRIVEIGCVELVNHLATGRTYHQYVNPERNMPPEAQAVHGLSEEFLGTHPVFSEVVDAFLGFLGDATLIIHNATFDMGFINAELGRLDRPPLPMERTVDTVQMARSRFPGAQANLDALCKRFNIDNSGRDLHGALLDSELLAEVYLELIGGRQPNLALAATKKESKARADRKQRTPCLHAPTTEETDAHAAFLAKLTDPLWVTRRD